MSTNPDDQETLAAPPALPVAADAATGGGGGAPAAAAAAPPARAAATGAPWGDFDPAEQFAKAYELVGPPVGALAADPTMEMIFNKITNDHEQLVVCRKQHESGLYEYHISGVFPVRRAAQAHSTGVAPFLPAGMRFQLRAC